MTASATGPTDLFAALNIATGEGDHRLPEAPTAASVLRFFKLIDLHVLKDLEIHVVVDNLAFGPQGARGPEVVGPSQGSAVAPALYPDGFELVEPRRTIVQGAQRSSTPRGTFNSVPHLVEAMLAGCYRSPALGGRGGAVVGGDVGGGMGAGGAALPVAAPAVHADQSPRPAARASPSALCSRAARATSSLANDPSHWGA